MIITQHRREQVKKEENQPSSINTNLFIRKYSIYPKTSSSRPSYKQSKQVHTTHSFIHSQHCSFIHTIESVLIFVSGTEESLMSILHLEAEGIYSLQMFTSEFCSKLLEECEHYEKSGLPITRPNSMNNYGISSLFSSSFSQSFSSFCLSNSTLFSSSLPLFLSSALPLPLSSVSNSTPLLFFLLHPSTISRFDTE